MKKLLLAVLACALVAPAFAVENVKVTGDIQTIGFAYENHDTAPTLTNFRGTTNRVLLGIGADLVEDVQAKLTFAHRWVSGRGFGGDNVTGAGSVLDNTFLAEAYVNISNVFDALEVKVGRQFYGDEKSAVMYFGPDYGYAAVNDYLSLDGVTARYNGENFALTAAYFSLVNGITGAYTLPERANDLNLAGLDLDLKVTEEVSANAYVYDLKDNGTYGTDFGFWGVKPTIEMDNLKLGVEYARNYGAVEKGWQVKADAALPIGLDNATLTPRLTYLKSEKKFRAFGNYRPGLMFGSVMAVQGMGPVNNLMGIVANWEIVNAGVCMKFANLEKWGFGLDFYTGEMDDAWQGNSWEAKAVYNVNQYVSFDLTGAILTNIRSWKHSPTAVQLGMNIKF